MAERRDESDSPRDAQPPTPADPVDPGPFVKAFDLQFSLGSMRPLPSDFFTADTLERLRSGGQLSADEIAKLQAATSVDSSMVARLLESLEAAGFTPVDDPAGNATPQPFDTVIIPGSTRKFEWQWTGDGTAGDPEREPATYYEALSGRPDPMRGFFIASRRLLDVTTWIIALGVPLGLVLLGVIKGAPPETIFFVGVFGLIVGMLFKRSFPRTPFG